MRMVFLAIPILVVALSTQWNAVSRSLQVAAAASAADCLTYHCDNLRTGWNSNETTLTTGNVRNLHQIFSRQFDGDIDAQPLIASNVLVPGVGYRNVLIVVTENNSLVALDADSGADLWAHYQINPPVPYSQVGYCNNTAPIIGITSTPVIDRPNDTIYVTMSFPNGGVSTVVQAYALSNGAFKGGVYMPRPSNSSQYRQRSGLLLSNGNLYIGTASFCDFNPDQYAGSMLSNIGFNSTFSVTRGNQSFNLGSVWMSGFAPAADAQGSVYFASGNGAIGYTNGNYAQCVIKLTSSLQLMDNTSTLFCPHNAISESGNDLDLGSGGVMLLPDQGGAYPHLAVAGGKTGTLFLLNRDWLGGWYQPGPDKVLFETQAAAGGQDLGFYGGPTYWVGPTGQPYVGVAGSGSQGARAYAVYQNPTRLALSSQTNRGLPGEGGSLPVVSSNGSQAGSQIMWMIERPSGNCGTLYLDAYDASNLNSQLLRTAAGSWQNCGGAPFLTPTVANGKVYVGSSSRLQIFSL